MFAGHMNLTYGISAEVTSLTKILFFQYVSSICEETV